MKKLTIVLSIAMLFVFAGFNTTLAADFSVNEIHWDDSNCSCSEPVQVDVRIVIFDINAQPAQEVHDSGWITDVDEPYSYYANDDDIRTDCQEPCYKVIVYVRIVDSSGTCCSGYVQENTTGYLLVNDLYTPSQVTLN